MKILWILPGSVNDKQNMIFAKRAIPSLIKSGLHIDQFFLESRSSFIYLLKSWLQVRRLIKSEKYDALHAQYGSVLGFFTWSLFYRYYVTLRGSDLNGDPSISFFRRSMSKMLSCWVAFWARKVICVSSAMAEKVIGSSVVLPSPTDLSHFYPIEKQIARSKLKIEFDGKMVGFAGGARPLKRRDLARQACELAGLKFLEIEKVPPEEMPLWLNACDILIFTSAREGSPNIIREAMACGLPVVSVDVGDVRKWIEKDSYSIIASPLPENLATALKNVSESLPSKERRVNFDEISPENYALELNRIYEKGNQN